MTDIRSDVSEVHPGVGDRVLEGVEEVPFVCEVVEVSDGFEELAVARLETVEEHVSKPTAGMSRRQCGHRRDNQPHGDRR